MSVTFVMPVYRVDGMMGGIGVRAWELAQVLAPHMPVSIVARSAGDLEAEGIRFVPPENEGWREALAAAKAAIFYDMPDTRMLLAAHREGKVVITDASVPIEHLEYHGIRSAPDPEASYRDLVARYCLQLLTSDHFIVRSRVARATLIAGLALVGRLGCALYNPSPELAHLISFIPIGFNRASADRAARTAPSMPPVDFVWSGGLWDFYDPVVAAKAIAGLAKRGAPVTLRFLYMPPKDQVLREAARLMQAIEELGIGHLVKLLRLPLSHFERDAVVKSSRAALCIGKPGIENSTSIRLRIRDSFLYGLPLVVDRHGATGDLVRALDIGLTVDSRDEAEVASVLDRLCSDDRLRARLTGNLGRLRGEVETDRRVASLIAAIGRGEKAPDSASPSVHRRIDELLAEHPQLERTAVYPI